MCARSPLPLILIAALAAPCSLACIFKFGTAPDSEAKPAGGTAWDYKVFGDDWEGEDAKHAKWSCMSGSNQSPINIPTESVDGDASLRTAWSYPAIISNGSSLEIINNGHAIQVEWTNAYDGYMEIVVDSAPGATIISILDMGNASDSTTLVKAKPLQFHFHTASEHLLFGDMYQMEMHIVSKVSQDDMPGCPTTGCISVTSVLFEVADGADNPALETIFSSLPLKEGAINLAPKGSEIPLQDLLPSQLSYYQYAGSLTTPPCTEGLLWHVFDTPNQMSMAQYRALMMAISDKECSQEDALDEESPQPESPHVREAHSHTTSASSKFEGTRSELFGFHSARRQLKREQRAPEHVVEMELSELSSFHRTSQGVLVLQSSPLRHLTTDMVSEDKKKHTWVCVAYAFSQNHRLPQPLNERVIKYFEDN